MDKERNKSKELAAAEYGERQIRKVAHKRVLTIYLLHLSAGHSRAAAWETRFRQEFPGINIVICKE